MTVPAVQDRAAALRHARVPFVHARVVLAEAPTSAKPGAEAIVLGDGTMEGFVGGSCAESTVRAQALALLDSGEPMLLRITPEPEPDQSGKVVVHNPCLSGGTLEVFLEPVVPPPLVVVAGESPIAHALVDLSGAMGHHAVVWGAPDAPPLGEATAVVVASHGRDDEAGALLAALEAGVPYVGLVASRKRGDAVVAALDVPESERSRVHTPAGLDIGARTPAEVALSVLAELVALRPRPVGRPVAEESEHVGPSGPVGEAVDPVCGMTVAMVDASLHLDGDFGAGDERVWFCGSGCLRAFAADPAAYSR